MSNLRHIFGLTAAISVGALIAGSGACAQAPTVSANPLAGIDPLTHAVPAERTASRHEFLCEGKPYVVEVTQTYVGGENLRRVNLSKLETPMGRSVAGIERDSMLCSNRSTFSSRSVNNAVVPDSGFPFTEDGAASPTTSA